MPCEVSCFHCTVFCDVTSFGHTLCLHRTFSETGYIEKTFLRRIFYRKAEEEKADKL
jgi:hypothetical protein